MQQTYSLRSQSLHHSLIVVDEASLQNTRKSSGHMCKCVIVHKPKSGLKPKRFRSKSFVLDSCHIPRNRSRHSTQSSRIDSPTPTTHPGSHPPPLPFLAVAKVRAVQVILSDVERDVRVVGQHGARLVDRVQFPATASCPPSGGLETTEQTITWRQRRTSLSWPDKETRVIAMGSWIEKKIKADGEKARKGANCEV